MTMDLRQNQNLKVSLQKNSLGDVTVDFKTLEGQVLGSILIEEKKLIPLTHAMHHFFKERATSAQQIGKARTTVKVASDLMEIEFE